MYGGSSTPESYCKITTYLQHHAPTLHDNIQDLCLFGAFSTRGGAGVTLLLPDSKTLKKIDQMVGKDSRKAVDMIKACILTSYLSSIELFRSPTISNKLGFKLPVEHVSSSEVKLSNGATITVDRKFKRPFISIKEFKW